MLGMIKQKRPKKGVTHLALLTYRRRLGWFAVLFVGLLIIQGAYAIRSTQPHVLGDTTKLTAQGLLDATNSDRHSDGGQPLTLDTKLTAAAQAKADDMVARNYWSHATPDGKQPWAFIMQAGYGYQATGENLAYGFATSDEVVSAWMNSAEHKANVLGDYTAVGFGIANSAHYQGGQNTVVVAFYATPSASASPLTTPATATISLPSQHVDGLAVVTAGAATWGTYASLGLIATAAIGFVVTHLELLRLGWYHGKHFLAIHPVFDALVVIVLALAMVYTAGGFIR